MATPSSSKKIQKVQQAGVNRVSGQRRPIGFPAAVVGIIVVGLILVWLARDARISVNGDQPRPNQDGWYQAWGLYNCTTEAYEANPPAPEDSSDISTRGDGLITVFPLSEETGGDNATLGQFFEAIGLEVTNTSVTTADGLTFEEGDECGIGSKKTDDTQLKLFIWPPQSSSRTEPEVVTEDFADVQFEQDRSLYALGLVKSSTDKVDLPSSSGNLSDPENSAPITAAPSDTAPPDTAPSESAPPETAPPAEGTEPAEGTVAPTTTAAEG